jgi:hypothetical protein
MMKHGRDKSGPYLEKGVLTEGAYTVIILLNKTYVSLDTTPSTTGQERYFYEFGLYNADI